MRVVYLLTSKPGVQCGVADYTRQLVQALNAEGVDAATEILPVWTLGAVLKLAKKFRGQSDIILHVQYPSIGMGRSPVLALFPLIFSKNLVYMTLHEFGQFHFLRKYYILGFQYRGKKIVFTNDWEKHNYQRYFPWTEDRNTVIPIGNNIDVVEQGTPATPPERLVYFGQIVKNKGIEAFVEVVRLLRSCNNAIPCAIIGAQTDEHDKTAALVRRAARDYGIEYLANLPSDEVSRQLSRSTIALLPFPEGVSDKRGSALACLKHGLSVITMHSQQTPNWWRETTHAMLTPEDAVTVINDILQGTKPKSKNPALLAQSLEERSWRHIALEHRRLYDTIG